MANDLYSGADLPDEDRRQIAAFTQIFLDAFNGASALYGVPVNVVAQQVFDELAKLAGDRKRLDEAVAEIGLPPNLSEFERDWDADGSPLA